MLLNNNLLKKLEQLQQEMTEMKGEDRKQKLDMLESEIKSVGDRLSFIYGQFSGTLHKCAFSLEVDRMRQFYFRPKPKVGRM